MDDLELVSSADALIEAFNNAKKECLWKNSVQLFQANLLENVLALQTELRNGTYKQQPFYEFTLCERGKVRHIRAMHIRDRVVQRSLCDNVLVKKLQKYCIYDNGASVKGKGISFARNRMQTHLEKYIRQNGVEGYILQLDFSNFFGSMPQEKVIQWLESKLNDDSVFPLIEDSIRSFENGGVGIGIGSQISQICGITYLTPVDNFCKIVKQCKFYGRYMDDLYIIHSDKQFLHEMLQEITKIAEGELGLVVNTKKTHITKLSKGFTFLKIRYNITPTGHIIKRLSRCNITRERRKLKKYYNLYEEDILTIEEVYNIYKSWRGSNIIWDSYNTIQNMDNLFIELFGDALGETNGKKLFGN